MRQCSKGPSVLMRGRDAPVVRGTVYVTASGSLIALAEVDRGEIVPKRVFNLAGLPGAEPADRKVVDDVDYC